MPLCLGASRSVRASTKHQSAQCAWLVHTFWPVDHPLAVDELGAGLDVGEVGPGARLAVALAPQLGAGDDPGQEALPLLVGAERDQGRAEQRLADVADAARRPRPGVLLEVHDLLVQREARGRRAPSARPRRSSRARRGGAPTPAAPRRGSRRRRDRRGRGPRRSRAPGDSSRKVRTSSRKASSSALNRRSMAPDATGRPDGPSDRRVPKSTWRGQPGCQGRKRKRRRLLVTTNTDDAAMAAPAISGLSSPAAASGRAATL